jgi:ribosomal protein L31
MGHGSKILRKRDSKKEKDAKEKEKFRKSSCCCATLATSCQCHPRYTGEQQGTQKKYKNGKVQGLRVEGCGLGVQDWIFYYRGDARLCALS